MVSAQRNHSSIFISSITAFFCRAHSPPPPSHRCCNRYAHAGGENADLAPGTIPTDPTGGYSHVSLQDLDGFTEDGIEAVRFYCHTSDHDRKIHFKTGNAFQAGVAFDGSLAGNSAAAWTSGFTALDGHSAYLPGATENVETDETYGFWNFPFAKHDHYQWGIRARWDDDDVLRRWECDDVHGETYAAAVAQTTLHQVWVRVASLDPSAAPSRLPSSAPSRAPTLAPSFADQATLALSLSLIADAPATDEQVGALHRLIANETGFDESTIRAFSVSPRAASAALRRLDASASLGVGIGGGGGVTWWNVSFTLTAQLSVVQTTAPQLAASVVATLESETFGAALSAAQVLPNILSVVAGSVTGAVAAARCVDLATFCGTAAAEAPGTNCATYFGAGKAFAGACDKSCGFCGAGALGDDQTRPTPLPSVAPSAPPSLKPSPSPTATPTDVPSPQPSPLPTASPTLYPTPECNATEGSFDVFLTDKMRSGVRVAFSISERGAPDDGKAKVVSNGTFSGAMVVERRVICVPSGQCFEMKLVDDTDGGGGEHISNDGKPWRMRDAVGTEMTSVVGGAAMSFCTEADSGAFDAVPSVAPTATSRPTERPSPPPSTAPSPLPTGRPTQRPTLLPSGVPLSVPTVLPTIEPTPGCSSGEYLDASGSGICVSCPSGTFSNNASDAWQFACEECPIGSISVADKSRCIQVRNLIKIPAGVHVD